VECCTSVNGAYIDGPRKASGPVM